MFCPFMRHVSRIKLHFLPVFDTASFSVSGQNALLKKKTILFPSVLLICMWDINFRSQLILLTQIWTFSYYCVEHLTVTKPYI